MAKGVAFDYFYGQEAEQFSFYRVPKLLIKDARFKDLSSDAKLLYGLMLDRMALSMKNEWIDKFNRAYIIYTLEQVADDLNCSQDKATRVFAELDTKKGIGLIERIRRGLGKPDIIYVKNFIVHVNAGKHGQANGSEEKVTDNNDSVNSGFQTPQNTDSKIRKTSYSDSAKCGVCETQDKDSVTRKLRSTESAVSDINYTNETNYTNTSTKHIVTTTDKVVEQNVINQLYGLGLDVEDVRKIINASGGNIKQCQDAIELLKTQSGAVRNVTGWLIKAIQNGYRSVNNKGARPMFSQFQQNDYDMEELERKLISN